MPACLLIADDLTGACDAAVHFAMRGYRTVVSLDREPEASGADVLAVSTESRGLGREELRDVFAGLGRGAASPRGPIDNRPAGFQPAPHARARILFKKIDSTLRGNVGAEVALAAEAFGCDAALVTPAFPAMGRTVESGFLRVAGADFAPVGMAAYWREQGLRGCAHVPPSGVPAALEAGTRYISIDAASDSDLDAIAAVGLASARRILWAGSAGLASALARALPAGPHLEAAPAERRGWQVKAPAPPSCQPSGRGAVLFCIGSDHPVTLDQQRSLSTARPTAELSAETAEPESILAALGRGWHVALRIPHGRVAADRVRRIVGGVRAPLVLTGGDTASLVCRALGVREIHLHREIAPGIPQGLIAGGLFDGVPVVTKSGAFGRPGVLIQIADTFACLQ